MINYVYVRDFILFDELRVDFAPGLNVFTGETGAGKSIIISAIDACLGSKAGKDLIRRGGRKAFIELGLKIDSVPPVFEENGIDVFDDELIISREITPSSSRSRVNGSLVPIEVMREIRRGLVDVHSQHQTYSYMSPLRHLSLLDGFGSPEHGRLLDEYAGLYSEYTALSRKIEKINSGLADSERRREFLAYQIREIESASISSPSEDAEAASELRLLLNAERLKGMALEAYHALEGDGDGAISATGRAFSALSRILSYDDSLNDAALGLESAVGIIRDAAISIRRYCEGIESDPVRAGALQERLDLLDDLKRKYGRTLADVMVSLDSFREELASIDSAGGELSGLVVRRGEVEAMMNDAGERLSAERRILASRISDLITGKLHDLELPKAHFLVSIEDRGYGPDGKDSVEFLVSVNVSDPPRPIAKTASGGEISRIMLALKSVFAESDDIDTVIFDEIDTGISGRAAASVAEELTALSKRHQVLVVTHQGVIAAKSSRYFFVEKTHGETTSVSVRELEGVDKLRALSAMVFGKVNEESIEAARLLL